MFWLETNRFYWLICYGFSQTNLVLCLFTITETAADSTKLPRNADMCLVHENGLRNCSHWKIKQIEIKIKSKEEKNRSKQKKIVETSTTGNCYLLSISPKPLSAFNQLFPTLKMSNFVMKENSTKLLTKPRARVLSDRLRPFHVLRLLIAGYATDFPRSQVPIDSKWPPPLWFSDPFFRSIDVFFLWLSLELDEGKKCKEKLISFEVNRRRLYYSFILFCTAWSKMNVLLLP